MHPRTTDDPTVTAVAAHAPQKRMGLRLRRGLMGGAAALAIAAVGAAAAFGPLVRGRVADVAKARHLAVEVGSVRPGWFSVRLSDVRARAEGVDGAEARLSEVRVGLTAALGVSEVTVRGGEIRVEGEPEHLAEQLRAWKERAAVRGEGSGGTKKVPVTMGEIALHAAFAGGTLEGKALGISRSDAGELTLTAGALDARQEGRGVELSGVRVELGADGKPRLIDADRAVVVGALPRAAVAATSASASAEPPPPPLPPITRRGKRAAKIAPPPVSVARGARLVPMPDPKALRAKVGALASAGLSRLPDGLRVSIRGLEARVDLEGESIALGPGPLSVERSGDGVHVAFSTDKADGPRRDGPAATPLSIDAEIPLGPGEVTVRLSGGPVSLALLGLKEGQRGLLDVARGTVEGKGQLVLAANGDALTFDGSVAVAGLGVSNRRLALEPLRNLDVRVSGRGVVEQGGKLRLDDARFDMGALHVQTHGRVEESDDRLALALGVEIAPAACQALLDSAPAALLPTVKPSRMSGTFGARGRIAFDTTQINKLELEYTVDDGCRMTEVPAALSRSRFAHEFTYRAYHPDGTGFDVSTGPGTSAWTDLGGVSPHVVAALLTTEDGAFYRHHGFNHPAIKSSILANLKARRFVRGASTITMQLAKNLFLSRQKTLSRKIEEVILTDYLEQVFRKDDILELYVNVVEFGPDLYGVTRAADHYFGRKPEELNVGESFFLASILPSPVRYSRMRDAGQPSERWSKHLAALFEIAARNGKITPAEATEAAAQPVVFMKPGDPRPEPRTAVHGSRTDPYGADDGWQPID
jgi:hypothetical protein